MSCDYPYPDVCGTVIQPMLFDHAGLRIFVATLGTAPPEFNFVVEQQSDFRLNCTQSPCHAKGFT
jgi:hypothetical protein